jgi:methionyl-tRNA formyltransferase
MTPKRIVCWIGDAPNHWALVDKIAREFKIEGIVIEKRTSKKNSVSLIRFIKTVIDKIRFRKIDQAWASLQNYYKKNFKIPPEIAVLVVDSINTPMVVDFTATLSPDLVFVSGTSVIKQPMASMKIPVGIINLHTGLSPYVKGGPNCTNWCIANNEWSLIGNTVLWLSAGIDSGNIISSERTDLSTAESLYDIHFAVMEHAHDLFLRSIRYIINAKPPYQSIPQIEIAKGKLYLAKMWTSSKKKSLLKNLKSPRNLNQPLNIRTISIPLLFEEDSLPHI